MIGKKLRTAFFLTLLILVAEVGGGILAHSLALLADAGHVLTDVIALGLAWFAAGQAERPANPRNTYGYHRTEILIALINAATLLAIVVFIAIEAIHRFQAPPVVAPVPMFVAAAVGIGVNLFIAATLREEGEGNLNVRAALLHVLGDVGASLAVVAAGLVILLTGWYLADPLLSLAIAALIAHGAWGILRESVGILMEATPASVNIAQLVHDLRRVPGVGNIHDLHVWSLTGGIPLLTAHVEVSDDCSVERYQQILEALNGLLAEKYAITHSTIQLECARCIEVGLHCRLDQSRPGHAHPR